MRAKAEVPDLRQVRRLMLSGSIEQRLSRSMFTRPSAVYADKFRSLRVLL
jgi:hypothetical protein